MKALLMQVLSKIDSLTPRNKIVFLIISMVIVFLGWRYCLWADLMHKKALIATQAKLAKQEMSTIENSLKMTRQKTQSKNINKSETLLVSAEEITHVLRDILFARHDLELLQVQGLPEKKITLPDTKLVFFEHGIVIRFRGSYFATLRYLRDLEELKWPFFWDKLDYKVVDYPQAEVTLSLHTVSDQEGWIHV
jgi:MSHA biogenesis protein MshJ